jgi:hypothetical protein
VATPAAAPIAIFRPKFPDVGSCAAVVMWFAPLFEVATTMIIPCSGRLTIQSGRMIGPCAVAQIWD